MMAMIVKLMLCDGNYLVQPPEEPDGDGGDDEGIAVEEGRGFGGDVLGEVLEQELVLLGESLLVALSRHLG